MRASRSNILTTIRAIFRPDDGFLEVPHESPEHSDGGAEGEGGEAGGGGSLHFPARGGPHSFPLPTFCSQEIK